MKVSQRAVSRILSPAFARLSASYGESNDHSSNPVIADGLQRPTRWLDRRAVCFESRYPIRWPPYLVLLRAGFCLPPVLPRARCALTAPFHHCPPPPLRASARQVLRPTVGCVFSVPLVLQVTLTGRYPAHCPAEFGLSSRLRASRYGGHARHNVARKRTVVWLTATLW